jgi:NitT/TauT family transport system permease protein
LTAVHHAVAQTRNTRTRRRWNIAIGRFVLLVIIIAAWQIASARQIINPTIVSSPGAVWHRLAGWTLDGTLWFHSAITIEETLAGFAIGSIAGIALGFAIGQSKRLSELLDPFILALYSIPKVALAPLFVVWFGIGIPMKIILAAITVLFIVFYNTLAGVRNVDPDLIDAMWLMGANSRQILFRAVVPSALGWALTGVRIAIPYALIGAIIGELIASNRGIGYLIASSGSQYDTAGVFAALLVLTILAVALNAAVDLVERRTSLWKIQSSVTVRGA